VAHDFEETTSSGGQGHPAPAAPGSGSVVAAGASAPL